VPSRVLHTVWNWRDPASRSTETPAWRRGLLQVGVLLTVAAVFRFGLGHQLPAMIATGLAVIVLISSIAIPPVFRGIEAFGHWLGQVVGGALTYVFLVPVWLLMFLPGGIILRMQGRDPLHRKFRDQGMSYWIPRRKRPDTETYERQFLVEDREARELLRPVGQAEQGGDR
jgi:hypothetical protein